MEDGDGVDIWEQFTDPESGYPYFLNNRTGESRWENPTAQCVSSANTNIEGYDLADPSCLVAGPGARSSSPTGARKRRRKRNTAVELVKRSARERDEALEKLAEATTRFEQTRALLAIIHAADSASPSPSGALAGPEAVWLERARSLQTSQVITYVVGTLARSILSLSRQDAMIAMIGIRVSLICALLLLRARFWQVTMIEHLAASRREAESYKLRLEVGFHWLKCRVLI